MSHKRGDDVIEDGECSPECLLTSEPVKDPYSSDEEKDSCRKNRMEPQKRTRGSSIVCDDTPKRCKLREDTRKLYYERLDAKDLEAPEVVLHEIDNACDMKPELVLFFLDVDFNPIKKHENIAQNETVGNSGNDSVEECLFEMFRFITHINAPAEEKEFKYNGQTMTEMKNLYMESIPIIKWLHEHDCYNWKDTPSEEIANKKEYFNDMSASSPKSDLLKKYGYCMIVRSLEIYEELINSSGINERTRRNEVIKKYFETLGNLTDPLSYISKGMCKVDFDLYVPTIDVPDGSPLIESRQCKIITKPDGIFKSLSPEIWKVMLEVYDASDEHVLSRQRSVSPVHSLENRSKPSPLSPVNSPTVCISQAKKHIQDPASTHTILPQDVNNLPEDEIKLKIPPIDPPLNRISVKANRPNKIPGVMNKAYCMAARNFAKQGLPSSCHSAHCIDKMSGQHVIQLFGQAFQNVNIFGNIVDLGGTKFQREIGMFVVNEYVYFSRLDIQPDLLSCISGDKFKGKRKVAYMEEQCRGYYSKPRITYSHFRLDTTRAYHRLALLIFITDQISS